MIYIRNIKLINIICTFGVIILLVSCNSSNNTNPFENVESITYILGADIERDLSSLETENIKDIFSNNKWIVDDNPYDISTEELLVFDNNFLQLLDYDKDSKKLFFRFEGIEGQHYYIQGDNVNIYNYIDEFQEGGEFSNFDRLD